MNALIVLLVALALAPFALLAWAERSSRTALALLGAKTLACITVALALVD